MYVEYLGGIFMWNICLEYSCRIFAFPNKKIYFNSYCCKNSIVVVNIVYFFRRGKVEGDMVLLSEGSSVKESPEDKQACAPCVRGRAKISLWHSAPSPPGSASDFSFINIEV